MATRRRDAGNSDLKARLGIQDAPEAELDVDVPAQSSEVTEGDYASDAEAPAGAAYSDASAAFGSEGTGSRPVYGDENYADAVDTEIATQAPSEGLKHWRDQDFAGAPAAPTPKLWIGLAVGGAIVAAGVGLFLGKASEANKVYNAQTSQAQNVLDPVKTSVSRLSALAGEMEAKAGQKYDASVDTLLAQAFGAEGGVVLAPSILNGARMLLADGEAGASIASLTANLQTLDALVKRHLALTQADLPEIQAEIAGTNDQTKYAIVFDVKGMQARYQAHAENPDPTGYQLVPGFRVVFPADATVQEVRQGQSVDYFYDLRMPDGKNAMIPIYGIVSIDKSQFESGGRVETAQSRWVARVAQIRTALAESQIVASRAATNVEDFSTRGKRFAF